MDVRFSTTIDHLEGVDGRVVTAHLNRTRQKNAGTAPQVTKRLAAKENVDLVVMAMGYRVNAAFASLLPGIPIARRAQGIADRRWQASGLLAGGAPPFARNQPVGQLALGRESAFIRSEVSVAERVWVAGDALIGPATVVEAMAQGRLVAKAILQAHPSRLSRV